MESFSPGGEWGGRAGTNESCCYKIILQPLVLPTLPLPPLRAATKCSVRMRAPHAPAWAGSLQQNRSVLLGKGFTCSLGFFGVPDPHGETQQCSLFSVWGKLKVWLFGEPELRGAGLKPINTWGKWQGGKLFMSTQEQCWHKNEWAETSRNKLGLEM